MNKDNEKNLKNQQFVPYFKELRKKYPSLSHLDILIYGEIYYKNNLKQGCFAGNEFFAEQFNESIRTIQRSISNLIEVGLVSRVITPGIKRNLYLIEEEFNPDSQEAHTKATNQTPRHDKPDTQVATNQTPRHDKPDILEEKNKENNKEKNKDNNEYNNNISKNLDLVEGIDKEVKSVVYNTSTNIPTGGDNIHSKEMEEYLNSLIRIEVEETLEEKIEKVKTKSSIKEGEFDIIQGNIEDKFSDYEIYNALNY
jgi:DNA-binding transcriptional regulator GbsR (MarR family)